jgi:hypothetical protein
VVAESGFHTAGQAGTWANRHLGKVPYTVQRRRVGVWENVDTST